MILYLFEAAGSNGGLDGVLDVHVDGLLVSPDVLMGHDVLHDRLTRRSGLERNGIQHLIHKTI